MNIGLTQRDVWRFMKIYFELPLKAILRQERDLIQQAASKANKIRERTVRKSL